MGSLRSLFLCYLSLATSWVVASGQGDATQQPLLRGLATAVGNNTIISQKLFWELEELARIVDISYCVGTAGLGIKKPFKCASRCADRDFETVELVKVSCRIYACRVYVAPSTDIHI